MKVDIRRPVSSGFSVNNGRVYTIEEAPFYRRVLPDTQYNRTLPCARDLVSTHNYYHCFTQPAPIHRFVETQQQHAYPMRNNEIVRNPSSTYNRFERTAQIQSSTCKSQPIKETDTVKITSFGCGFRRNVKQPQTTVPWQKPVRADPGTYQTVNQVFQSYVRQDRKSWRAMRPVGLQ